MSNCFIDFKLTKILLGSHIASQDIHLVCTTQGISNPLLSKQEAKWNQYVFDVCFFFFTVSQCFSIQNAAKQRFQLIDKCSSVTKDKAY